MTTRHPWVALLAGLALTTALTGCVEDQPSLHPLFLESDRLARHEIELAGDWVAVDGDLRLRFEPAGDDRYLLQLTDEDGPAPGRLDVRFGRLSDAIFADFTAGEWEDGPPFGTLPVHVFARVRLDEGRLLISFLNRTWLQQAVEAGEVAPAHERVEGKLVLTAPTDELQALVGDLSQVEEAFDDPLVYVRAGS